MDLKKKGALYSRRTVEERLELAAAVTAEALVVVGGAGGSLVTGGPVASALAAGHPVHQLGAF